MNYNINETCATCLRKTKVVLLDLNSFDPKRRKIRFKRCKKKHAKRKRKRKRVLYNINFGQNLYQHEW